MKPASPEILSAVPLYSSLRGADLDALAAVAEVCLYARGDVIFRQGTRAITSTTWSAVG